MTNILLTLFFLSASFLSSEPLVLKGNSADQVLKYCKERSFQKGKKFPVKVDGHVQMQVFSTGPCMLNTSINERIVILDVFLDDEKINGDKKKWLRFYFTLKVDDEIYIEMQNSESLVSELLEDGKRITQYVILTNNNNLPSGYELVDSFRRESELLWKDGSDDGPRRVEGKSGEK